MPRFYRVLARRLLVALSLVALSGLSPTLVSAHNANQQPFVSLNGADALLYNVGSTSLTDIELPQDMAPANYLVGQPISFQLKPLDLPFPAELIPKLQIHWDFGDGTSSDLHDVSHTYTKMGTYVVRLTSANPSEGVPSQLLDLIFLNVIPTADYKVPQSVIQVNGRQSTNVYTDILDFDFKTPLKFTANTSVAGSSPITSYFWDFGDQSRGTGVTQTHSYTTQWSYVSVMLRLKTKDGFMADSMVQLENPNPLAPASATPTPVTASTTSHARTWEGIAAGIVAVAVIGGIVVLLRRRTIKTDL